MNKRNRLLMLINKKVTAICDQIRTVDKSRLKNKAGVLDEGDLTALENGLRQVVRFIRCS